ncbi:hypothetical protein KXD40_007138 [Peronospora effusa]|uniref:Uncharacterized protein n=1 Tax=Peronospora effusa TaxID=542832 RepID=A0A3M6VCH6_9STRA|nr:hypothetical protein DD238_006858 [Peronospora effusa]RQM09064.1 hypothetical protein DD237_006555 [Peronospora effusa]UIZ28822.1 hypothetical protein KXD40_007138 [Peronospora effusa]
MLRLILVFCALVAGGATMWYSNVHRRRRSRYFIDSDSELDVEYTPEYENIHTIGIRFGRFVSTG